MSAAQVRPLDVRAQVFAPDLACRRALDARAILGRHAATGFPHRDEALADTEESGELRLPAGVVYRALKC